MSNGAELIRVFIINSLEELPLTVRFYKEKNGNLIYKDYTTDKFYIVERHLTYYRVYEYKGDCTC